MKAGTYNIATVRPIALRDLTAIDLRREAAALIVAEPIVDLGDDDIDAILNDASTEEPFAQHPALAFRVRINEEPETADALVDVGAGRVGIAWNIDSDYVRLEWGDLGITVDLTTEAGGDAFATALRLAIWDWAYDPEAWEARCHAKA